VGRIEDLPMADKRTGPGAHEGARRGKRAAPTIDLTATEVKPAAAAGEPVAEPAQAAPPPPVPEPPPVASDVPPAADNTAIGGDSERSPGGFFSGPTLAASTAGAMIVTLVLFALWLTGWVPIRYAGSTAMRARVAGLEMELRDLKNRPAGAIDSKSIDALDQRIGKIEDALAKLPAGEANVGERLAAADNAMKALGVALAALNKRSDDIAAAAAQARERAEAAEKAVTDLRASVQELNKDAAKSAASGMSPVELDALQKRMAALEQSAKSARDDIAKTTATDTAMRLALSAAALRTAAANGAPFAAELAQVQTLGGDDKALAPLTPFAATGVPTRAALAEALRALAPAMLKASGAQAPAGGFLERLQANAGKLVRIRPVDAPAGDDAATLLARIEIAAANADIAGALADLGKLNDATRAPAQDWIKQARASQAALAAARQFAADSARALGAR
jgi:archaellum component FlaC